MKNLQNFLKLSRDKKILLINTLLLHWKMRFMVWIIPFSKIKNKINDVSPINSTKTYSSFSIETLIWAVNVSSRYTVRSTCLTQAMTAQILLAKCHYSSSIMIGVAKNEGEFEAHAWLVHDDHVVLGESEKEYVTIMNMSENNKE